MHLHMFVRYWFTTLVMISLIGWAPGAPGQPRRSRPPTTNAAAQNAQTPAPTPNLGCNAFEAGSAQQHRRLGATAFASHDWPGCVSAYTVAVTLCSTPEARFNLGHCLENLGRLREALEQYRLLRQGEQLPPNMTPQFLDNLISTVQARVPAPALPPPRCDDTSRDRRNCGRCGHECALGQICRAGICLLPTEIVTPRPSRALPWAMAVSGGVVALAGASVLTLGLLAAAQAESDTTTRGNRGCAETTTGSTCYAYAMDARTPASVADLAIPVGAVALGFGIMSTAIGVIWLMRPTRQSPVTALMHPLGSGLALSWNF